VNWFKAQFFGSWLRIWSFRVLRNLSFASLFYPCIVSSHIGSFANLAGYPPFKPTSSFVLTSLTYLPITWVWRWHVTRRCFKGKIQCRGALPHGFRFKKREDSSYLSSRHLVPTLTPLPLCSETSKRLSMGEEVLTMQFRVLGEIKKWIR
jgi:hypothetical protein